MIRLRFILPLIVFMIIVFFFWKGMSRDPNLLPSMLVDKPVPNFTAPTLNKKQTISTADFKNKIVLLNVWATWCDGCQIEHPLLMDLAKNENIQIYGLNYKDNKENAVNYLNKVGNPYQQIIYDKEGKYAMQLGVYGTPETFLIDKKGIIRYRYVGALTLEVLEKDLLPRITKIQEDRA